MQELRYIVHYQDGTIVPNLTHQEAIVLFTEAQNTANSCSVHRANGHLVEQQLLNG